MGTANRDRTHYRAALLLGLALVAFSPRVQATAFASGSTGADGPLDLTGTASGTTVEFDPTVFKNASGQPLDPEGDNIYNFTTITIPTGVTLRMHAWKLRNPGPAYFLALGAVDIEGTIDLSGNWGHPQTVGLQNYGPAEPGPGGFPGGLGVTTQNLIPAPTGGAGPGGAPPSSGCNYITNSNVGGSYARGQSPYGNLFLLPLVGGSGGAGQTAGGGAGGGALLLASNVSITVNGEIMANGGDTTNPGAFNQGCGGPCSGDCPGTGSGGAIRLLSPIFTGSGVLSAEADSEHLQGSFYGWIRVETAQNTWTGSDYGIATAVALSPSPVGLPGTSSGFPTLIITSIGGVTVPAAPTGTFNNPDVNLSTSQPLTITLAGANVPPGTVATVQVFNQTLGLQTATATLSGTTASSTGTATVTLPPGVSLVYANATWTN